MITVRPVAPDEWRLLREIRLAALRDSPFAFGSTYARELGFDEQVWRLRVAGRGYFLAVDGGSPVGLAAGYRDPDALPGRRELVSMWITPAARGYGVAALLIDAVAGWARADGADELALWVVDANDAALRAYRRAGFVETGERQPVLPGDPRMEQRMVLGL